MATKADRLRDIVALVVVIEPRLANRDAPWMRGKAHEVRRLDMKFLMRMMRVRANRAPDLVMRFGKSAFDNPEIGNCLHELLPDHGVSAMVKEQLMNFIWDMTSGSLAGRVALFENVNATPAPALRARLYNEVKRDGFVAQVKKIAGIE